MAGWDAWNSGQLALYRGAQPMLALRGLTHLFIPLGTAFKCDISCASTPARAYDSILRALKPCARSCRYFEFFMLEYRAIPINACIFVALCLSCIVQCMISSVRKAHALSSDGQDRLDIVWNYCTAFSFLCVLGILYVPTSSAPRSR
jgi:hypothetical protein